MKLIGFNQKDWKIYEHGGRRVELSNDKVKFIGGPRHCGGYLYTTLPHPLSSINGYINLEFKYKKSSYSYLNSMRTLISFGRNDVFERDSYYMARIKNTINFIIHDSVFHVAEASGSWQTNVIASSPITYALNQELNFKIMLNPKSGHIVVNMNGNKIIDFSNLEVITKLLGAGSIDIELGSPTFEGDRYQIDEFYNVKLEYTSELCLLKNRGNKVLTLNENNIVILNESTTAKSLYEKYGFENVSLICNEFSKTSISGNSIEIDIGKCFEIPILDGINSIESVVIE